MSTYTIHVRYDDDPAEVEQFAGTPAELVAWALEHVGGRDPARAVIRVLEAARRAAQVGG